VLRYTVSVRTDLRVNVVARLTLTLRHTTYSYRYSSPSHHVSLCFHIKERNILLFSWLFLPALVGDLMITHVVLAKLNDRSAENIESTRVLLRSLSGRIPSLRFLEVGKDLTRSEGSYDVALIAKFDDLEGLNTYRLHPIHVPVSAKLKELAASTVVVDYQSD